MPDAEGSRRGGRKDRDRSLPSERAWERSAVLHPQVAPYPAELISDGVGIPFPRSALSGTPEQLDADEPAVAVLLERLPGQDLEALKDWRVLARNDGEVLFGRGEPPNLVTVAVRREGRRERWTYVASNQVETLRAARDGIRASSWRLDPAHEPKPEDTTLRVLVTEQAFASGQKADGRVLPPDLHLDDDQLVLTVFVTPRKGYQTGSRAPEAPVRVALPEPLGSRRLVDGAVVALDAPASAPDAARE
jgi:hypothetical protein